MVGTAGPWPSPPPTPCNCKPLASLPSRSTLRRSVPPATSMTCTPTALKAKRPDGAWPLWRSRLLPAHLACPPRAVSLHRQRLELDCPAIPGRRDHGQRHLHHTQAIKARGGRLAVLTNCMVEVGQFVDEIGQRCEGVDLGLVHCFAHDLQGPLTAFPEGCTRRNAAQVTVDCKVVARIRQTAATAYGGEGATVEAQEHRHELLQRALCGLTVGQRRHFRHL